MTTISEGVEAERLTWWRRIGLLRLLLTGLPVFAIGAIVIAFALSSRLRADEYRFLPVGSTAPAFRLPTTAEDEVSLDQHLGRHPLLMFLNEGIGCDPCWDQIVNLEKDAQFKAMDVELISIMVDPPFKLKPEVESRGIRSIVAADVTRQASKDFGALGQSMHPGIKPGHSFILVDRAGIISWRWDWTEDKGDMYLDVAILDAEVAQAIDGR